MARARKRDPKSEALAQDGVLNPNPGAVRDLLFTSNPFFDAKDLVQVRYEMVRCHHVDGVAISAAAAIFAVGTRKARRAKATRTPGQLWVGVFLGEHRTLTAQ